MFTNHPFLSVVIPSYNEMSNVSRGVLDAVVAYLKQQDYTWEVILSDDGSSDGTLEKLQAFAHDNINVRVLANPHGGKGPTVQSGILEATGEWRLFTDFDQSTPLSQIERLLPFTSDFPIVIGSREIAGSVRGEEPWYRHVMGKGFNFFVQILAIPGIFDTQCGFKLFSAAAAEKLFKNMVVYRRQERPDAFTGAFDVEILYLARKHSFGIKEVAISWEHFDTNRVSPLKDSFRMLRDILSVRLTDLQGKYSAS